jgi:hypothetical protein
VEERPGMAHRQVVEPDGRAGRREEEAGGGLTLRQKVLRLLVAVTSQYIERLHSPARA